MTFVIRKNHDKTTLDHAANNQNPTTVGCRATPPLFPKIALTFFHFMNMRWLIQEGPDAKKHKERAHPVAIFVIHYTLVISTTFYAHDVIANWASRNLEEDCTIPSELAQRRRLVGPFLGVYILTVFAMRLALQWNSKPYLFNVVFYEQTFMCSVTIVSSALGFCFHRPLISQAFCITVGIDQLLW